MDVYVKNLRRGTTTLASVASDGSRAVLLPLAGGGLAYGSGYASISADCRYVAFLSDAINLVPSDTNGMRDVFVHDMLTRTTRRVSVASNGAQANGASQSPVISADGRYVAFHSAASNLVPNDSNNTADVFVSDLRTHRTTLVSATPAGRPGNATSLSPSISADGRYISFGSSATDLVAGKTGQQTDIFVRDMRLGRTTQVSVASDGSQPSFSALPSCTLETPPLATLPEPVGPIGGSVFSLCGSAAGRQAISDDGRYVVFMSNAQNLVPNDSNYDPATNGWDVFVHDLRTHRTERVSVDPYGQQRTDITRLAGDGVPTISGDGRVVAYVDGPTDLLCSSNTPLSNVGNLLPLCTATNDVFIHRLLDGADEQASVTPTGAQPRAGTCGAGSRASGVSYLRSDYPTLSRSGDYLAFQSSASDLVVNDKNGDCDAFVRNIGPSVGTGGLTRTQPPSSPPPGCGLPVCPPIVVGAGLQQVRVVPRQNLKDLFVRWDVTQMTPVSGAPASGLLCELRFTSGGQHYAVRAQRVPGPDYDVAGGASFGLFRESLPGVWTHVASLKGGYGTIGDSVVTAVPLSALGGSTQLTDVTAYTAVGSYLSGPTKVLDSLRLSR